MSDKTFYSVFIGFIVGIGLHTSKGSSRVTLLFFLLFFCLVFCIKNKKIRKNILYVFLGFVFVLLGSLYSFLKEPFAPNLKEQEHVFLGKIVTIPENRNNYYEYVLKTKDFRILITNDKSNDLSYGQIRKVKLSNQEIISKNNKNYKEYLLSQNITIKGSVIDSIKIDSENKLYKILNKSRNYIKKVFDKFMTYPESGLASGLIIGSRDWMNYETYNEFIKSGTIHIVALSGYNISVLISLVRNIFIYILPILLVEFSLVLFIILFLIMTGLSTTGLRAGVMALVIIFARNYGISAVKDRLLIIAGVFLLIMRPYALWYDLSYQLSIIATFSVLFMAPVVHKKFLHKMKDFWADIFATTISATIFTAPIIVYTVGSVSIVSIFSNIIIVPIVPLATGLNILLVSVSFIEPLAYIIGGFNSFVHSFIFFVSRSFANLPFSQIQFEMPKIILITIYALLVMWVIKEYKKNR